MQAITPVSLKRWDGPFAPELQSLALAALEAGSVLYDETLAFPVHAEERELFAGALSDGRAKNISFDPAGGHVQGAAVDQPTLTLLAAMMQRFARDARALITGLFPRYGAALEAARTSYRPCEIAGRASSWRKDDTRLHVDAFPSRPMRGRRILRVFTNVDPGGAPRRWRIGEPFADFAQKYASRVPSSGMIPVALLSAFGITKGKRSAYDQLMLGLHDAAKSDARYQAEAPQLHMDFPAGATWICYTDQVLHAAYAGRFCLEQTFHLDVAAMAQPELAPLKVLERITGRALV